MSDQIPEMEKEEVSDSNLGDQKLFISNLIFLGNVVLQGTELGSVFGKVRVVLRFKVINHMIILFLIFKGTVTTLLQSGNPFFIPTNKAKQDENT